MNQMIDEALNAKALNARRDEATRLAYWAKRAVETAAIQQLDTAAVKRLWDAYDGMNSPLGYDGETIHMELNRRGEGRYCAV